MFLNIGKELNMFFFKNIIFKCQNMKVIASWSEKKYRILQGRLESGWPSRQGKAISVKRLSRSLLLSAAAGAYGSIIQGIALIYQSERIPQ